MIIKCRAWHTELKKMFSADELGRDQMTLCPDGRGFVNVNGVSERLSIYMGNKMIPLLFSGHTDKHGREVYEGDILKRKMLTSYNRPAGTRRIVVQWGEYGFNIRKIDLYEIIGNIHEHPELIP